MQAFKKIHNYQAHRVYTQYRLYSLETDKYATFTSLLKLLFHWQRFSVGALVNPIPTANCTLYNKAVTWLHTSPNLKRQLYTLLSNGLYNLTHTNHIVIIATVVIHKIF
jgi:hypothetical protein